MYIQLIYHLKKSKEAQLDSSPIVHLGQESQDHPYVMDLNLFYKVLQVYSALSFYHKIFLAIKKFAYLNLHL